MRYSALDELCLILAFPEGLFCEYMPRPIGCSDLSTFPDPTCVKLPDYNFTGWDESNTHTVDSLKGSRMDDLESYGYERKAAKAPPSLIDFSTLDIALI